MGKGSHLQGIFPTQGLNPGRLHWSGFFTICATKEAPNLKWLYDNIQARHTPFPIWNQSVVPCPVLLLPDLHTNFSRGRSDSLVFLSLEEFPTVCCDPHKGFGIVNKAEIDDFLELLLFQ